MGCSSSSSAAAAAQEVEVAGHVPMHGISQEYLVNLVNEHSASGWTVGEFCEKVVKPMTVEKKCSLTTLLLSSNEPRNWAKPKADVFISYAWKYSMGDLIACLERERKERFLWIDVAVVNQHKSTLVGQDEWLTTFSSALKEIGAAELILMPWQKPIPVDRCWCVFEQYVITSNSIPFKATMLPKDEEEVRKSLRGDKFMYKTFMQVFGDIDCEKSTAFKEDDRREIIGLLRRRNAVKTTNDATMQSVKKFLIDVALDEALKQVKRPDSNIREQSNVYYGLATLYDALEEYTSALKWYETALPLRKKLLEQADPSNEKLVRSLKEDIGSGLNGLGSIQRKLGKLDEAKTNFEEAYQFKIQSVGEDDADAIKLLGCLASIHYEKQEYQAALNLFEDVLARNIQTLGSDHAETGNALNNVGSCYNKLGRYDDALKTYSKALEILIHRLGDNHPEVATAFNNLAVCYDNLQRPDDAIDCYRKAIVIQTKALGENSTSVAIAMHNLAMTLADKGETDEASALGKKALAIFERSLGKDHPNTKTVRAIWG